MNEMIERVARKICKHRQDSWESIPERVMDDYLSCARVAIEAMREPTDAMQKSVCDILFDDPNARRIWQAMIDSALGNPYPLYRLAGRENE
jgi:hypothetical protein